MKIHMIRAIQKRYCYKSGHTNDPLFDVLYNFIHNTQNTYVASSVYLHSASRERAIYLSCVFLSSVHLFHLPRIIVIDVGVHIFL